MKIDKDRIENYLMDIKSRAIEIENFISTRKNKDILSQTWLIRGLKYLLIEMAEIMSNTLAHILAKDRGVPVTGYIETIIKSGELGIIQKSLADKLKPFLEFRNSLVHRYWTISDEKLLILVRENHKNFHNFIEEIEKYVKSKS